nr:proteasome subunit alpha type-7 [Tanacetum cinerariifolium]
MSSLHRCIEYALEAVRKGNAAVGVRGTDIVVLGVEKKSTVKLQDSRSVRKIVKLDDHIALACAGLKADVRVLINKARTECQSHKLILEDPVTVEYITRYIAGLQQKYTQSTNYKETSGEETIKLTIRALLEVVESGGKNIKVAVMTKEGLRQLKEAKIDAIVEEIEAEKAASEAAKKGPAKE